MISSDDVDDFLGEDRLELTELPGDDCESTMVAFGVDACSGVVRPESFGEEGAAPSSKPVGSVCGALLARPLMYLELAISMSECLVMRLVIVSVGSPVAVQSRVVAIELVCRRCVVDVW